MNTFMQLFTAGIFIIFYSAVIPNVVSSQLNCPTPPEFLAQIAISYVRLRLYYGTMTDDYVSAKLENSTDILRSEQYNASSCTVIYMFGWASEPEKTASRNIIEAYLSQGIYNLILVDWSSVASTRLYPLPVFMIPRLSQAVAPAIDALVDGGANICHFVGMSLGAHAVGHVSRYMKNPLKHIIALDPAGPLFNKPLQCVSPLSRMDAECVEVIHTDSTFFGTSAQLGTVDYWVNGKSLIQPGCLIQPVGYGFFCSHRRSIFIFLEVIRNSTLFAARLCKSSLRFSLGFCRNSPIAYIGQCNNETVPGNYYIRTSGHPPYSLGQRGARPAFLFW